MNKINESVIPFLSDHKSHSNLEPSRLGNIFYPLEWLVLFSIEVQSTNFQPRYGHLTKGKAQTHCGVAVRGRSATNQINLLERS